MQLKWWKINQEQRCDCQRCCLMCTCVLNSSNFKFFIRVVFTHIECIKADCRLPQGTGRSKWVFIGRAQFESHSPWLGVSLQPERTPVPACSPTQPTLRSRRSVAGSLPPSEPLQSMKSTFTAALVSVPGDARGLNKHKTFLVSILPSAPGDMKGSGVQMHRKKNSHSSDWLDTGRAAVLSQHLSARWCMIITTTGC